VSLGIMKKQKIPKSIISTQVPEEIANAIKTKADSMDVTPDRLVGNIIHAYIEEPLLFESKNTEEIKDIENK
jgi:hypothetical protein